MSAIQEKPIMNEEGKRFLEQGNYEEAVKILAENIAEHPDDGESHALLALAHFHREEYESAVKHYKIALEHDADNKDWREMLSLAQANLTAEIHVPVPDIYYFERDKLLAKPVVPDGALPSPPPPLPKPGLFKTVRIALGNFLGIIVTAVMAIITQLIGRVAGYRDEVWTNWYRRPFIVGILTLAYMREQLNAHSLKDTYPKGSLVGFSI